VNMRKTDKIKTKAMATPKPNTILDVSAPQAPAVNDVAAAGSMQPAATPSTALITSVEPWSGCADATTSQPESQHLPPSDDSVACSATGAQLEHEVQKLLAEKKILTEAYDSMEQRLDALQAQYADKEHTHIALNAQLQHLLRMIRAAESTFYHLHVSNICAPMDGAIDWPRTYGKLVAALKPVFLFRDI
jgi:hypothetical protein